MSYIVVVNNKIFPLFSLCLCDFNELAYFCYHDDLPVSGTCGTRVVKFFLFLVDFILNLLPSRKLKIIIGAFCFVNGTVVNNVKPDTKEARDIRAELKSIETELEYLNKALAEKEIKQFNTPTRRRTCPLKFNETVKIHAWDLRCWGKIRKLLDDSCFKLKANTPEMDEINKEIQEVNDTRDCLIKKLREEGFALPSFNVSYSENNPYKNLSRTLQLMLQRRQHTEILGSEEAKAKLSQELEVLSSRQALLTRDVYALQRIIVNLKAIFHKEFKKGVWQHMGKDTQIQKKKNFYISTLKDHISVVYRNEEIVSAMETDLKYLDVTCIEKGVDNYDKIIAHSRLVGAAWQQRLELKHIGLLLEILKEREAVLKGLVFDDKQSIKNHYEIVETFMAYLPPMYIREYQRSVGLSGHVSIFKKREDAKDWVRNVDL